MSHPERRRRRSERSTEALLFLFQSVLSTYKLDAIVLADHDGLVIQSSGDPAACDLIAAYAPLVSQKAIPLEQVQFSISQTIPAMSPCSVAHRPLGGVASLLHVCAIGTARNNLNAALQHSTRSIERILAETAA